MLERERDLSWLTESTLEHSSHTLTNTLQLDLVVEESGLAVALVGPFHVEAEAPFADLRAKEGTLVRIYGTADTSTAVNSVHSHARKNTFSQSADSIFK